MAGFADFLIGLLDRHLTQDDVRKFLVTEYQAILDRQVGADISHDDLDRLGALLAKLGWIDADSPQYTEEMDSLSHIDGAELWMEKLYSGHVISRGVVMPGTGENLDILDFHGSREEFVQIEAERLLRHVENRRAKSLNQFSEDMDSRQVFKEKVDILFFFSRYALRHHDPRFLNSAFKLTEWLMDSYRKIKDDQLCALFLLALAQQEQSAGELLK